MAIKYPFRITVPEYYLPQERLEWCYSNVGRGNFDTQILNGHTTYLFKNNKDATWFALNWS